MGLGSEELVVYLRANIDQFQEKLRLAGAEAEKQGSGITQKMGAMGGAIVAGAAVAVVGFGALAVKAAMTEETAHAQLLVALKNTNQGWAANKDAVEAANKTGEKYGYTAAQTETQLGKLITATGSTSKATSLLSTAQNVAAKYHIDLATAVNAVTKGSEGYLKPLKALGIDLPIATQGAKKLADAHDAVAKAENNLAVVQQKINSGQLTGTKAADALAKANGDLEAAHKKVSAAQNAGGIIIDALNQKTKDAANQGSKTLAGQMATLKAEFEDAAAKIGTRLIPILKDLIAGLMDVIDYLSSHHAVLIALGVVVGTILVAAFTAWAVSLFATGGALAFLLSPITLIVLAVLAIIAAVVLVWTNWDQIWNWIMNHPAYAIIIAILAAPIALFVLIIGGLKTLWDNWDQIWGWIKQAVSDAWDAIQTTGQAILDFFNNLPTNIVNALGSLATLLVQSGIDLINGLINGIVSLVGTVLATLFGLVLQILNFFAAAPGWLVSAGIGLLIGFFQGIASMVGSVLGALFGLVLDILGVFGGAAGWLVGAGWSIMVGLWQGIASLTGSVWDLLRGLAMDIINLFGNAGSWLVGAGQALISGLWNGIQSSLGWLWDRVSGFASGLVNNILGAFGIGSPSKVFAVIGGHLMTGLSKGIEDGAAGVNQTLKKTAGKIATNATINTNMAVRSVSPSMAGVAAGSASNAAAGQTNQYTISVQVAPGGNPRDTGAQIVDLIKSYERGSGTQWRDN